MEPQERKRYSRQIIMPEIGLTGQEKLKNAKVLVIGAGGLGCPVLQYLVAAGVGTIGVIDDDVVDITNLHRQVLYCMDDVGKGKADTAVAKLSALNPFVDLIPLPVRFTEANAADLVAPYDLVIDGSDNFPTRYLANDTCVALNKPLVFGSILRFEGQVSVFNYKGGPTYRCLFPEADENEGENCAEAGVLGILPGIIGSYMANEVVKLICEIGEPLSGKLLVLNALTNNTRIFNFGRSVNTLQTFPESASTVKKTETLPNEMAMEEVEHLLETAPGNIHFVDVREEYEFEEDFVAGVNIPLPDLPANLTQMPTDKTLVFYCSSGIRSKKAADLMAKNGFPGKSFWTKRN